MESGEGQISGARGLTADGAVNPLIMAAHELKSPLATIRQLSLELSQTADPAQRKQLVEQITLTSERSLRLTEDLTRSTRLQSELFTLEPIHPRRVLCDIVSEMKPLYRAHGRRLEMHLPTSTPLIVSHYDLLRRVLINFVDNALHYSSETDAVSLTSQTLQHGEVVRFGVRDRGPRVARTRKREYSRPASSGLGLIIADTFADVIGADVGTIHHRDGMSYYIDVPASKQLSLVS
jgi:two-component system sensor histidine kinase BarA